MSASRNINVLLTANASQLKTTLAAAGNDVQAFERKVDGAGSKASKSMKVFGAAAMAGGLVAAAGFAYSINAAIGFEKRMRNVNSISGLSEKQLGSLGDQVKKMSTELPQSANELAEGLYDIASSGFQGAEGMEVLRRSAEAASAGLSTTAVSARAITAVLNAYGLQASDAAHVSNVLFQGVNVGVMSFEELAGTVGDFAGTAAAAGVSIDQATGALATMTLAGISAAEAGTSLNRLLQAMIQPGDALNAMFKGWGFESGEAALKTLGLKGTMDKLREATGGNITTMLQLFPEIRAARGALALMSAEGDNYAKVSKSMTEADKGQGATRKALAEQMKSTAAQFQLFVNWLNQVAITIGSKALPAINDLIGGAKEMFSAIGGGVTDALDQLSSFFADLVDGAKDFVGAGKDIVSALTPMAKLIGGLTLGAFVVTLKLLGSTLAFVADVAHRFSGVLAMLAIGYATIRGYDMLNNAFNSLGTAMQGLAGKAKGVGGDIGGILAAVGPAEIAVSGFAVGLMIFSGAMQAAANESAKAKTAVAAFTERLDIDTGRITSLHAAVREYHEEIRSLNATANGSNLENVFELVNPMAENKIQQARERRELLGEAADKAARQESNLRANTRLVGKEMGVSRKMAEDYAKKLGVDLTTDINRSAGARKELVESFRKTREETHVTKDAIESFSQESMEALEEAMKAEMEFLGDVEKAVKKTQDIWSTFGKDGASKKALTKFYAEQVFATVEFTDNITKAIQMGLNPAAVTQALQAGPAEAGKLLEDIVSDSTGNMVKLVNAGADALAQANTKLLEMARIAHKASTAESSSMVRDAGAATRISLLALESNAFSSAKTIADKLGMPIAEVKRIAEEYGIVVDIANGKPFDPSVNTTAVEQTKKTIDELGKDITKKLTKDTKFSLAMDITDPVEKTQKLNALAVEYVNSNPTTKAYFETLDAEQQLVYISGLLESLPGTQGGAPLLMRMKALADIEPAKASIGDLESRLKAYAASDPETSAYLETHSAEDNAAYLMLLAKRWSGESPEAKAYLDNVAADLTFQTTFAWAQRWRDTRATAHVNAQADTTAAERALQELTNKKRIAYIQSMIIGGAAPGQINMELQNRHGRIHHFARGGTTTQAHVQDGERIRYAEKGTGGEAFIPRKGKPGRSLDILGTAAGWYGHQVVPMRAGGVLNEDERGYNWKTMGNHRAGATTMKAFHSGLLGDWNNDGRITDREWKDWQTFGKVSKTSQWKKFEAALTKRDSERSPAPGQQRPKSGGSHHEGRTTYIEVKIMAPVYGVDQLNRAIRDGAVQAFGSDYDRVVGKMRTKEDSRR